MTNHQRTQQVLMGLWFLTLVTQVLAIPNDDTCPQAEGFIYSPFKPYFSFWPERDSQSCWAYASCLFIEADESRKQQFAATALVMGLVPLTLKDIAWPERRLIPVSKKLPALIEIIVLALGLVPVVAPPDSDIREAAADASPLVRWAWKIQKRLVLCVIVVATVLLLATYGAVAVVEIYSKRSALGCPFPAFVLMWHLVGLVPATCHVVFHNMKNSWSQRRRERRSTVVERGGAATKDAGSAVSVRGAESSAVQGGDEWWLVQLSWAIYYIAGTLIFTSIMGLTVIELVAWVVIEFAVTGASKFLALFLCLSWEEIPW